MKALLLGGVKSGKSRYAEQLALDSGAPVVVIVTARADDEEMAQRIQRHQEARPENWRVIEEPMNLSRALSHVMEPDGGVTNTKTPFVIVDCLTLWVTQLLCSDFSESRIEAALLECVEVVKSVNGDLILVSNETNMGIIPMDALSRRYCDLIGRLHQSLAIHVDEVTLMVAGLPMKLKQPSK